MLALFIDQRKISSFKNDNWVKMNSILTALTIVVVETELTAKRLEINVCIKDKIISKKVNHGNISTKVNVIQDSECTQNLKNITNIVIRYFLCRN